MFSCKQKESAHPALKFGDTMATIEHEHEHVNMILDSKLDPRSHFREDIVKARRGIGKIRYFCRHVSREILCKI